MTSIFLAILVAVAVTFAVRGLDAHRRGMVWSNRRRKISRSAFGILMLQICNVACMLAVAIYASKDRCNWQQDASLVLGYVQWTMWNITFLCLICLAHNGSLWRGQTAAAKAASTAGGAVEDAAAAAVAAADAAATTDAKSDEVSAKGAAPGAPPPPAPPVALVLDAPMSVHLPKLIVWAFFQIMVSLMLARYLYLGFATACTEDGELVCGPTSTIGIIGVGLTIFAIACYMAAYLFFAWRTERDIKARSYMEMKFARMVFGVQHEQVAPVFMTLTLSTIILCAVNAASCWTFVTTWLGVVAVQAVGTSMACTLAFFYMPKRPQGADQIMAAWLQEFAWSGAELPVALRRRNAKLADSRHLAKEPMFCMETCVKLINFSSLIYSIREDEVDAVTRVDPPPAPDAAAADTPAGETVADASAAAGREAAPGDAAAALVDEEGSRFIDAVEEQTDDVKYDACGGESEEFAGAVAGTDGGEEVGNADASSVPALYSVADSLSLYDLTHTEIIYDRLTDTKALMAWGGTTLVVAFKGTSSFENVVTDLNLFKTFHPPKRMASMTSAWGLKLIRMPVLVHTGFLTAWMSNGYDRAVVTRVGEVMEAMGGPEVVTLLVTGHSLGGALATLAAHALKTAYPSARPTVYTYGQPRVGNRAFAHEYNKMIEEHFAVINCNDPVTTVPKGAYKRVGDRVILRREGDIIVRPTYLEMHLIKRWGPKPSDHYTDQYRASMMAGIKAQFTSRRLETGQPGAAELARWVDLTKALVGVNLTEEALLDPELTPTTLEEVKRLEDLSMRKSSRGSRRSFGCGGSSSGGGGDGAFSCGGGCGPMSRRRRQMDDDADEAVEEVTKDEEGAAASLV